PVPTRPPPAGPPPPAYTPPPAPRYPLFYDELFADQASTARAAQPPAPPTQRPAPGSSPASPPGRRPGVSWLAVALTVVILVLVGVIGGLLMFAGGDDEQAGDTATGDDTAQSESSPPPSEREPSAPSESASPSSDEPQDVARFATPSAPKTAKPNLDTQGNLVRYSATNMVDGVAETCWRMAGDGTGTELTFGLSGPTELTEVGLINGYAKRSGKLDWYAGNRRVLAVEWVFDDGTVVPQSLSQSRKLQTLQIDPVTTSSVKLRLVSVSEPGRGPSARNYTPISDVMLYGTPG
ncbi:MAG TPA: hypothetical protein VFO49_14320, partial [Nocardioides sp.]|nr:hypothetical protein [Nocardioides sp.]